MTKTDAAVQTLAEINPDVILEVGTALSVQTFILSLGLKPAPVLRSAYEI